jgi:altronate dehydratase
LKGELVPVDSFDLEGNYDIILNIATAAQKQDKSRNLSMVLQQLGTNPNVPQSIVMRLTAELTGALGMNQTEAELMQLSEQMKEMEQQPKQESPEQQMAMQMELQHKQAMIAKDSAQAKKYESEAVENYVQTELNTYGIKD